MVAELYVVSGRGKGTKCGLVTTVEQWFAWVGESPDTAHTTHHIGWMRLESVFPDESFYFTVLYTCATPTTVSYQPLNEVAVCSQNDKVANVLVVHGRRTLIKPVTCGGAFRVLEEFAHGNLIQNSKAIKKLDSRII